MYSLSCSLSWALCFASSAGSAAILPLLSAHWHNATVLSGRQNKKREKLWQHHLSRTGSLENMWVKSDTGNLHSCYRHHLSLKLLKDIKAWLAVTHCNATCVTHLVMTLPLPETEWACLPPDLIITGWGGQQAGYWPGKQQLQCGSAHTTPAHTTQICTTRLFCVRGPTEYIFSQKIKWDYKNGINLCRNSNPLINEN